MFRACPLSESTVSTLTLRRFPFLRRSVQFGGTVNQDRGLYCHKEQTQKSGKHSTQRQTIQHVSNRKRIQERLCRLFAHVLTGFIDHRLDSVFHPLHSAFGKLSNDFSR